MMPPLPCSTLFPYTTLFRSGGIACKRPTPPLPEAIVGEWESWCVTDRDTGECLSKEREGSHVTYGSGGTLDRKSTRLNSSHPSISYAVFCLKKKKEKRR